VYPLPSARERLARADGDHGTRGYDAEVLASHQLRVFDLTQPTVSHDLSALEAQLRTSLFVRGRRGVELTSNVAFDAASSKEA
jgi:DNA-binding transcriptional ArsR family regulator